MYMFEINFYLELFCTLSLFVLGGLPGKVLYLLFLQMFYIQEWTLEQRGQS